MGEMDRIKIRDTTMENKAKAARAGRMPCGIGRGMYGLKYNKKTKKMEVVEEEAAVLRMIYRWRLDGMAIHAIAKKLNELGILTKNGCQWESRTVRTKLKNIAYTGRRYYGMKRHIKGNFGGKKRMTVDRPESEWILVEGYCPRIIEDDVFYRVQEMWGKPQSPTVERRHRDYPFTGIMVCGKCGTGMGGSTNMGRYPYYVCGGTQGNAKRDAYCDARRIRADWLEPVVVERLKEIIRDPSGVIEDLRRYWQSGNGDLGRQIANLKREIAGCVKERRVALSQLMKELISEAEYEEAVGPVTNRESAMERDLETLERQQQLHDDAVRVEERVGDCFAAYVEKIDGLDGDGISAMLRQFQIKIVATVEEVVVTGEIAPGLFTTGHTLALRRGRSCRSRPTGIRRGWMNWLPRWRFCRALARLQCLAGTAR